MEAGNQSTPDIGSMLNGLLSNPSALSSLMSVLGSIPNAQGRPPQAETTPPSAQSEASPVFSHTDASPVPEIAPVMKPLNTDGIRSFPPIAPVHSKDSREKSLLLAIRPFLSKNKCDTLDIFIKLLDIISLVGRIK